MVTAVGNQPNGLKALLFTRSRRTISPYTECSELYGFASHTSHPLESEPNLC